MRGEFSIFDGNMELQERKLICAKWCLVTSMMVNNPRSEYMMKIEKCFNGGSSCSQQFFVV